VAVLGTADTEVVQTHISQEPPAGERPIHDTEASPEVLQALPCAGCCLLPAPYSRVLVSLWAHSEAFLVLLIPTV
jgi:hypothetical protein